MIVTLPDEVVAKYLPIAEAQGRPVEAVLADQLHRFQRLPPGQRAVVIPYADLKDLEKRLSLGAINDGSDLVEKVKQLAGVSFCNIDIGLTTGQLKELEHRARKQGCEVIDLIEDTWKKLQTDFFYSVGDVKVTQARRRKPAAPAAVPATPATPPAPPAPVGA